MVGAPSGKRASHLRPKQAGHFEKPRELVPQSLRHELRSQIEFPRLLCADVLLSRLSCTCSLTLVKKEQIALTSDSQSTELKDTNV